MYAQKIEALLTPLVGDFMSKMAVKSQCKKLGITPEQIAKQHLDPLAAQIGAAISINVDKPTVDKIVTQIKSLN
ncbi:hypothetical protein JXL21_07790 [Candidatus Bathyarchaeota archaeon]|nr:hypothetical protein [Candidatus Bathyarchaeota archaeon]